MEYNNIHSSCSTLPIFNFFELVRSKDLNWLKIDIDQDSNLEELESAFANVLSEYNELTNNKKLIKLYQSKININYLEAKYHVTKQVISIYLEHNNIEILLTLRDLGFSVDSTKPIMPQISRINKSLIGLKNRIKIERARVTEPTIKEIDSNTPHFDLEKQVVMLETAIPLSYKIDIYKDSIKRYLIYNEILIKRANV